MPRSMTYEPLHGNRLELRRPEPDDAPHIQRLAGDWEVAQTLALMPHPYEDGMAEAWIALSNERIDQGVYSLAVVLRSSREYIGGIRLAPDGEGRAMLGYWIGRPYWQQGFAGEAARVVATFGFDTLGLTKIVAMTMTGNIASRKLLMGLGCTCRGREMRDFPARGEMREVFMFELTRAGFVARRNG